MASPFKQDTKDFLAFLQQNKPIRDRIAAEPNKTLLYAGRFFKPIWRELEELKATYPAGSFTILPDVLERIAISGSHGTLKRYVQAIEAKVPWMPDGFTIWRALSGIYASNARGKVFFSVGSGVDRGKVLAATEIAVLSRNPHLDPQTRDIVAWLQKCIATRTTDINFGLMPSR
ncbi:hypothetical protein [uncultured Bosea sp.]|uniref:hypothetical protein n=1 Tax=uncultured Bosea sp. TaxID=211457 RepID=UPI0025EDB0F6|nr:hypothetical protein [uncultured Bosea sp.]